MLLLLLLLSVDLGPVIASALLILICSFDTHLPSTSLVKVLISSKGCHVVPSIHAVHVHEFEGRVVRWG